MKIKNYAIVSVLLVSLLFSSTIISQEKYQMVELTFMLPKIGMEKSFVDAVKSHNDVYHKDGPYKGHIDRILTGKKAGWFVWLMGPCTFSDLDSRPESDEHDKHWADKVAPTIAKYGSTEYWKNNPKLSYKSGTETPKLEEIWFLDIKKGDYYRFKALITKVKAAFEKKGKGDMQIYNNQFNENNGRDVAIVWGMNSWAEMDDEDSSIKSEYEEINGEGSWENMLDDWEEITVSVVRQMWEIGI